MIPTSSAMPATPPPPPPATTTTPPPPPVTPPASTVNPTASTSATTPFAKCKCRPVRHEAKRGHRNAGRQNAYRSLRHGTLPTELLSLRRAHRDSALHQLSTSGAEGMGVGPRSQKEKRSSIECGS